MDANKLEKLKQIKYQVRKVCGLCIFAEFPQADGWGTCDLYKYAHQKHADSVRQLSITQFGGCPSFEANDEKLVTLHGFLPLMEGDDGTGS